MPVPDSAADATAGVGHRLASKVLIPLALLLLAIVLVFYVLFNRGRVDGPSMLPTLHDADMLLLTKSYDHPRRGDIVFAYVDEQGTQVELVKRVIALPGDTIEIRNDVAYVNGVREPQRGQRVDPRNSDSVEAYRVPDGYVYLLGDNRPNSTDSRYIGPARLSGVRGRVVAIYAPVNRVGPVR